MLIKLTPEQLTQIARASMLIPKALIAEMADGYGGRAVVKVEGDAVIFSQLPQQVQESAAVAELRAARAIDQRRIQELRAEIERLSSERTKTAPDAGLVEARIRDWLYPYARGTFRVDADGDIVIERVGISPSPVTKLVEVIKCS